MRNGMFSATTRSVGRIVSGRTRIRIILSVALLFHPLTLVINSAIRNPQSAIPSVRAEDAEQHPATSMNPDGRVLFYYADPFANKVQIGGEFNGWDPSKTTLIHNPDGSWTIAAQIREGRYGWKWVIDGQWENGDNHRLVVVRGKTGRLEVLLDQPTFNTPYNSRIYFSGRFYGQSAFRNVPEGENVDTGRTRFAPLEFNLQPRMLFTAGDKVTGYMEVDINGSEGRAQTNFSEGEAALTEDWGRFLLFRRRRVAEFTNPMRSLDFARNTIDDKVYFTTEERPTNQWFGRQYDRVRRNSNNDNTQYTYQGFQGFMGELNWNKWKFVGIGADHLLNNENIWAGRATWTGDFFRFGTTFVMDELPRGIQAETVPGSGMAVQRRAFTDTGGGYIRYPGSDINSYDLNSDIYNYDALYFLTPNGRNRQHWWGADIRVGPDRLFGYAEIQGRKKDFSFVARENGDNLRPDGSSNYYADGFTKNVGEYLAGGREDELSALFGVVYFPMPRLGLEIGYRLDDGTALSIDRNNMLRNYQPSANTFHIRGRYDSERFKYSLEAVRRSVRDFPNTGFEASFDNYNFADVRVVGASDQMQFKQDLTLKLGRWTLDGGHRFRRYNLFEGVLEASELKGMVGFDLTRRINLALTGRMKAYSLPNTTALTMQPNRPLRFYSSGLRAVYNISQYVNIDFGIGVNQRNDEDIEEGQSFFLRESLAKARRATSPYGHTLDQVVEAERILSVERRLEFNINARF